MGQCPFNAEKRRAYLAFFLPFPPSTIPCHPVPLPQGRTDTHVRSCLVLYWPMSLRIMKWIIHDLLGSYGCGWTQFTTCLSPWRIITSSALYLSQIKMRPQSLPLRTKSSPQKLASLICQKENENWAVRFC